MQTTHEMIGESDTLRHTLQLITHAAFHRHPVLLLGESGTGKAMAAKRLHYLSNRWQQPYLTVNCASYANHEIESLLCGHEATATHKKMEGYFSQAHKGSIFFDNLQHLPLYLQEKLVAIIETGFLPIANGITASPLDIRIIAALPEPQTVKQLLPSLYYQLTVEIISLPPLRERGQDILLLTDYFATQVASELKWASFPGFSSTCQQQLLGHAWPGNVRELRAVVERTLISWPEPTKIIDYLDLTPLTVPSIRDIVAPPIAGDTTISTENSFKAQIKQLEITLIKQALLRHHFHQVKVAKELQLSYHQLRTYLRKYEELKIFLEK